MAEAADRTMRKGDLLPELKCEVTLVGTSPSPENAVVKLCWQAASGNGNVVEKTAVLDSVTEVASARAQTFKCVVRYAWVAGDTDEVGDFIFWWHFTYADLRTRTTESKRLRVVSML